MKTSYSLFLLILFGLTLSSCRELSEYENKQVQEALSDSLFTTTESWDIHLEIMEEGLLKVKLNGSYAASIKKEKQSITKIRGPIQIEIFNEQGNPDTYVQADSAIHSPNEAWFELFGNVRVNAPEGKKLRSDYLKWDRKSDRVSTPEFVIFIAPPDSIAAKGFYGNTDLTNYTLNEGGGRAVID